MLTTQTPVRSSLNRQVNHWLQAASRLSALEHLASEGAWHGIDYKMGKLLKESLQRSINDVLSYAKNLNAQLQSANDDNTLPKVRMGVIALRDRYLKAEQTIHFYTIAVNSRTTPNISALLRACDILCIKSMEELLVPLNIKAPYVLTYVEKGVGASILKAGLRLWDGNISPIAAIKVTQHNLFRPTAIIHETGHQVAHILNWNEELAAALFTKLNNHPKVVSSAFSSWSSEIAADAFSFVHTGFGSVAALHDVITGTPESVFAYHVHDPHPISYVRIMLGFEMCRQFYGPGPWDNLEMCFKDDYDLTQVNYPSVELIKMCVRAIPEAVNIILRTQYQAFDKKSISQMIPPERVSPKSLDKLEYLAGPALFTSHAWLWRECIKLLALTTYKIGVGEQELAPLYKLQEEWMVRLGYSVELN